MGDPSEAPKGAEGVVPSVLTRVGPLLGFAEYPVQAKEVGSSVCRRILSRTLFLQRTSFLFVIIFCSLVGAVVGTVGRGPNQKKFWVGPRPAMATYLPRLPTHQKLAISLQGADTPHPVPRSQPQTQAQPPAHLPPPQGMPPPLEATRASHRVRGFIRPGVLQRPQVQPQRVEELLPHGALELRPRQRPLWAMERGWGGQHSPARPRQAHT